MDSPVSAKAALLFELSLEPGYARQLVQRFRDRTKGQIELLDGSVYPVLRELEDEGLAESFEGGPSERPRRCYRLTKNGQAEAKRIRSLFALLGEK